MTTFPTLVCSEVEGFRTDVRGNRIDVFFDTDLVCGGQLDPNQP